MTRPPSPDDPPQEFYSEFDRPEDSPGLMLWRVTNAWQATQRATLTQFDLTHVQFVLLSSLCWLARSEPVTQRQLAEYAHTDIMMTSQVLRRLETKGLLDRRPHPTDARARWLVPTDAGLALANAAGHRVEAADREFFSRLGPDAGSFQALLASLLPPRSEFRSLRE